MQLRIYNENNWADYKRWFNSKAQEMDIYYDPFLLESEEFTTKGKRKVLVVEDGNNFLLYPLIQQIIPIPNFESYSDVISPYGYCGPFWSGTNPEFKLDSEKLVCNYFKENKIVNEFIRYHYLYNENATFEVDIQNTLNRKVVLVSLNDDWENIWSKQFSSKNRNLIRKLDKDGYKCFETTDHNLFIAFINLYYQTMDNAGAIKYYYFSKDYFIKLESQLGEKVRLFVVMKDGLLYNAALFYVTKNIITYHLSARNVSYPNISGSNFLLGTVVKEFSGNKWQYLNLGGGTNAEESNPLFKFKLNFSKQTKNFLVGKRIHLPEVYKNIMEAYISTHGRENLNNYKHILQFYR